METTKEVNVVEPKVSLIELSVAERYYLAHKKRMGEYQKRNKDKVNERNRLYLEKIKEDPERRKAYLEKKREYYFNKTKPKRQQEQMEGQMTIAVDWVNGIAVN
jgi:hypothetical protein